MSVTTKSGKIYSPSHLKRVKKPGVGSGNNPAENPKHVPHFGEENGRHKLNESKVKRMRKLFELGVPYKALAVEFSISTMQVGRIIRKVNWKHI